MTTYRQLHEQKLILDIELKGLWTRFLEHRRRFLGSSAEFLVHEGRVGQRIFL
jgi:hypothetical protein